MKALGAYIFAGGFTVGVSRHFKVVAHLEGNDYGVATARLNWPKMPIRYGKEKWQVDDPSFSELDFIYANPPCAIFSPMGIVTTKGAGSWRDDPRLDCWKNSMELVETLKPKAFALESVCQAYTRGREVIDEFTRRGLEGGYSVTHLLLDAKWTGIPQSRKRFFLVFHRQPRLLGYQFNWSPPPTVGEVLATVDDPGYFSVHSRADWLELIMKTPQGGRLANTWESLHPGFMNVRNAQGKIAGRPSFQDRRLKMNEIMGAWVGDKFYHPTEVRAVGVNEGKAICGYPEDFKIAPSDLRGWGSLLARAVMPPVGEWLARAIKTTLSSKVTGDRSVFRVDVREQGIEPVDLTDEYIDGNGHVIVRHEYGAYRDQEPENEMNEDDDLTPATSASSLHEPRKPGPAAPDGRSDVERQSAARPGPDVSSGPVSTFHRDGSITTEPDDPVYDHVAMITQLTRDVVGRVAVATAYTDDDEVIAAMTGIDAALVKRATTAIRLVRSKSPAGKPVAAPAARISEEPVEPTRDEVKLVAPVLESRSAEAGAKPDRRETSRKRAVTPPAVYTPGDDDPKPHDGEGSGVFIRRMLMADKHTPDQIVGLVLANYAGRKTTVKDVAWNYQHLKNQGIIPPPWRGTSKPGSYPGGKVQAAARVAKLTGVKLSNSTSVGSTGAVAAVRPMVIPPTDKFQSGKGFYNKRFLAALIALLDPSRPVIDVGANVGYVTRALVEAGAAVTAYEPSAHNFAALMENVKGLNGVTLRAVAVSDTAGERLFHDNGTTLSHFVDAVRTPLTRKVKTVRIDDDCSSDVGLLKVDVEGFELEVLRGATEMITRCRPTIVIECEEKWFKRAGYTSADVFGFMRALGYGEPEPLYEGANDLVFRPTPRAARVIRGPLKRIALVEWYPRVCGSVAFGGHLSAAKGVKFDRISFTKSGKPHKDWWAEWPWRSEKYADAPAILNGYDAAFFIDVACFSPNVQKSGDLPLYASIYEHLTVPYSGMFHGGLYPSKYDAVIDALVSGPAFSGALLTTRLEQARARLSKWPNLRFVHHPWLPYDDRWANGVDYLAKKKRVLMTARLASNKGQNALLAVLDRLDVDVDVRGYNSFGLPSIGWKLYELGGALGYREDGPPKLRADCERLTHPNASKFYTGKFALTSPSGRKFAYHGGFDRREDVDWSPWLHLSLPSREFGDTLEYVSLDAIASGCVAVVPQTSIVEAQYAHLITIPYEGCSVWANDAGEVRGREFGADALVKAINGLSKKTPESLANIASLQREEIKAKHSPTAAWAAAERAIKGEGR